MSVRPPRTQCVAAAGMGLRPRASLLPVGISDFSITRRYCHMNVRTLATLGTSALIAGLLTACGSKVKLDDTPVENRTPAPVSTATPQSQVQSVTAPGTSGSSLLANQYGRIVYFDFDSYVVRDEYRPMV